MIGTMLCGGLGNQMFQYAAGRALAARHGTELVLNWAPPRLPVGSGVLARPFELKNFSIRHRSGSLLDPAQFMLARRPSPTLRALSGWQIFREQSFAYDEGFASLPDRTYLFGYWHSWRYFKGYTKIIFDELQPQLQLSDASLRLRHQMARSSSLAIHIRRGDYVNSVNHHVLDLSYYRRAVRLIQDNIQGLKAFIFSDDPRWCADALQPLGLNLVVVDENSGRDSWQDLFLISFCQHAIIANSTFSWWGAWLGDHQKDSGRLVVAPDSWSPQDATSPTDRYPPSWRVLPSHEFAG